MGVETTPPKISIVTPSYNQGKYLEKTILSVLEQNYPNLEYIIIDGGSTDESVEIIKKYADRLTYWVSEPDRGQSHAINKGFERATGEIFGWLNSDDWYHAGALQAVADAFAANPEVGAVVGAGEMVDEEGRVILRLGPDKVTHDFLVHWMDNHFWQPSCFFTGEVWSQCGPLDENLYYAMDLDLWLKIAEKYRFVTTAEPLTFNLKHEDAKTTRDSLDARIESSIVIARHNGEEAVKSHLKEFIGGLETRYELLQHEFYAQLAERDALLAEQSRHLAEQSRHLAERDSAIARLESSIINIYASLSWKISAPLRWLGRLVQRQGNSSVRVKPEQFSCTPYRATIVKPLNPRRSRIVHALGNFMTGGSSRLVVDLFEHLGHLYEQEIITSYAPNPQHYLGLTVREFPQPVSAERIFGYFRSFRPDIIHVYYWGESDKPWYEAVFSAAKQYGCQIVENVNTPVEPFFNDSIKTYVYVSNYVRTQFGCEDRNSLTIYPGSNFAMFSRSADDVLPDDCIGMVYRLEPDKLNEQAIEVFIKVAKLKPDVKILIVGGGTFLERYREAVRLQEVADSFVFTGYVAYEDLPAVYKQMSIFVAPVWKESFGQVSPFAMSMGIPVVGYDIGALAEIIGDRELLAPPGDSDHLADIIVDLLENREKRLIIGKKNQARAQLLFSVETMVNNYDDLYKSLLGSESG